MRLAVGAVLLASLAAAVLVGTLVGVRIAATTQGAARDPLVRLSHLTPRDTNATVGAQLRSRWVLPTTRADRLFTALFRDGWSDPARDHLNLIPAHESARVLLVSSASESQAQICMFDLATKSCVNGNYRPVTVVVPGTVQFIDCALATTWRLFKHAYDDQLFIRPNFNIFYSRPFSHGRIDMSNLNTIVFTYTQPFDDYNADPAALIDSVNSAVHDCQQDAQGNRMCVFWHTSPESGFLSLFSSAYWSAATKTWASYQMTFSVAPFALMTLIRGRTTSISSLVADRDGSFVLGFVGRDENYFSDSVPLKNIKLFAVKFDVRTMSWGPASVLLNLVTADSTWWDQLATATNHDWFVVNMVAMRNGDVVLLYNRVPRSVALRGDCTGNTDTLTPFRLRAGSTVWETGLPTTTVRRGTSVTLTMTPEDDWKHYDAVSRGDVLHVLSMDGVLRSFDGTAWTTTTLFNEPSACTSTRTVLQTYLIARPGSLDMVAIAKVKTGATTVDYFVRHYVPLANDWTPAGAAINFASGSADRTLGASYLPDGSLMLLAMMRTEVDPQPYGEYLFHHQAPPPCAVGAPATLDCTVCGAGYYASGVPLTCIPCPIGTAQEIDSVNVAACSPCAPGFAFYGRRGERCVSTARTAPPVVQPTLPRPDYTSKGRWVLPTQPTDAVFSNDWDISHSTDLIHSFGTKSSLGATMSDGTLVACLLNVCRLFRGGVWQNISATFPRPGKWERLDVFKGSAMLVDSFDNVYVARWRFVCVAQNCLATVTNPNNLFWDIWRYRHQDGWALVGSVVVPSSTSWFHGKVFEFQADGSGNLMLVTSCDVSGTLSLQANMYTPATGTWSSRTLLFAGQPLELRFNTHYINRERIGLFDAAGNFLMVFTASPTATPGIINLYYVRRSAGTGTWSAPVFIRETTGVEPGDYSLHLSPTTNVVWLLFQKNFAAYFWTGSAFQLVPTLTGDFGNQYATYTAQFSPTGKLFLFAEAGSGTLISTQPAVGAVWSTLDLFSFPGFTYGSVIASAFAINQQSGAMAVMAIMSKAVDGGTRSYALVRVLQGGLGLNAMLDASWSPATALTGTTAHWNIAAIGDALPRAQCFFHDLSALTCLAEIDSRVGPRFVSTYALHYTGDDACVGGGSGACVRCNSGTYLNVSTDTACTPCAAGTFTPFQLFNLDRCEPCPAGTFQPAARQSSCAICPAGTYSPPGSTRCIDCPIGYFQPLPQQGSCTPCPGGTRGVYARATTNDVCVECGIGNYSEPASSVCSLCPPGTFSSFFAAPVCSKCPRGTYNPLPGRFVQAECLSCSFGSTTLNEGSASSTDCVCPGVGQLPLGERCVCGAGYSYITSSGQCTPCSFATYKGDAANTACVPCPVNSRCLSEGGTSITQCVCDDGWFMDESFVCRTCPRGGNCTSGILAASVGFWRPDLARREFRPCLPSKACAGGRLVNDSNTTAREHDADRALVLLEPCAEGYAGFMCAMCDANSGYAWNGVACLYCNTVNGGIVFLLVFLTIVFVLYVIFTAGSMGVAKLSILLNYLQLLAQSQLMLTSLTFLPIAEFNWLVVTYQANSCLYPADFSSIWVFTMMIPLILLGFVLLYFAVRIAISFIYLRVKDRSEELRQVVTKVASESLSGGVLLILYNDLLIAKSSLLMFVCVSVFDRYVLSSNYSFPCGTPQHIGYVILSALWIALFNVSLPIYLFLAMQYGELHPALSIVNVQFLMDPYRDRFKWWELVNVARRVCFALIVVLITLNYDLALRSMVFVFFMLVFTFLHLWCKPYRTFVNNLLEWVSLCAVISTFLLEGYTSVAGQSTAVQVFVLTLNGIVFVVLLISVLYEALPLIWDRLRSLGSNFRSARDRMMFAARSAETDGDRPIKMDTYRGAPKPDPHLMAMDATMDKGDVAL